MFVWSEQIFESRGLVSTDRREILLYWVRHPDSELGRLRMIRHLHVVTDRYCFGKRTRC